MILVAIDPGLDSVGIARFEVASHRPDGPELHPRTVADALTHLMVPPYELKTDPGAELPRRLERIRAVVNLELLGREVQAVVEMPAVEALYRRNRGLGRAMARNLNRLHMGIGAVLAAVPQSMPCHLVRADGETKGSRQRILALQARIAGVELPRGPRGGVPEDAWDATWLGCRWLAGDCSTWEG